MNNQAPAAAQTGANEHAIIMIRAQKGQIENEIMMRIT